MKLTTTAGTTVEVPVSLPDCITVAAYLPTLCEVYEFAVWPDDRERPEHSEPKQVCFARDSPGLRSNLRVSPEDLEGEENDKHLRSVAARLLGEDVPLPFIFLSSEDQGAVSEAAGDALEYIADRLGGVGTLYRGKLAMTDADRDTLRAIADMRAAELAAREAWGATPEHCRRGSSGPVNPATNSERTLSAMLLARHVEHLSEQAQKWSEDRAEALAREARREALEASRTDAAIDAWKDGVS